MDIKTIIEIVIAVLCSCLGIAVVEKWFWSDKYQFGNSSYFFKGLIKGLLIILGITFGLFLPIHYIFF